DVRAALRDLVGLGRRFGALQYPDFLELTWTPNGQFIFVVANEQLYRSTDGGRTFAMLFREKVGELRMTADGRYVTYRRNGIFESLPTNTWRGPMPVEHGYVRPLAMLPNGQAVYDRPESAEICLDTFDLAKPTLLATKCVPVSAAG